MTTPPPDQPPQDPNGAGPHGPSDQPGYPGASDPSGYPGPADQPGYPGPSDQPGYPGYPGYSGHPGYPGHPGQQPYGAPGPYGNPYAAPGHGMPYGPAMNTNSAMWAHLGTLIALSVGSGMTCGLSAVLAWVVGLSIRSGARDPFTREHATAALNLALTSLIYSVGMVAASVALAFLPRGAEALQAVPWVLLIAYGITVIVFTILATVAANKGRPYRYPAFLAFPMVKA
ncbi:DUF4870 domain-containing protein [Streptomyces sp. NPDC004111]|uniref:DUF4870 domain-containing protein n=1 Tax=Streptomyces sp. NPDC004111 TaxID=3364690 RepID=UPI00368BAFBF